MSFHVFFLHCFNLLVFSLCVDRNVFILIIFSIGCQSPFRWNATQPLVHVRFLTYIHVYIEYVYIEYIYIYNLFSTIFFFISTIYILVSRATRMGRIVWTVWCDEIVHIWKTIIKFNDNRFNRDNSHITSLLFFLFFKFVSSSQWNKLFHRNVSWSYIIKSSDTIMYVSFNRNDKYLII